MLAVKIAGLGWYLPKRRVTNMELEQRLGIPAAWVERVAGVQERRYVDGETVLSMGVAASHRAIEDAGLRVTDLDALICASTTPYQAIPCTAAFLQRALQAPEGLSACFDINATCLSFLFALHTAAHLIVGGAYKHILICSSELPSSSLNPQERESMVLFGDAAAAAVITRSQPGEASAIWHTLLETHSSGADLTVIEGGGTLHHPNDPLTIPEMNMFHMQGTAVFKQATLLMGPFLQRFFSELDWRKDEVDMVVPHQASKHAIESLSRREGFPSEKVLLNMAYRGNTLAASIPLTLAEAVEHKRVQRGDRILLVGSGAGLTLGAMALTF